jgi:hypothetical protein
MAKMKSGNTSWMGGRVTSERALLRGIKSDAAQFGVRSPGRSVASRNTATKSKNPGNAGSFGTVKQSRRASINSGGNGGKIGY